MPDKELQKKDKRYYFSDSFKLKPGQIFVSPLDLNVEHGHLEKPIKPMIRFGTPVVDIKGQKRGIVLLNYFGAELIQDLSRVSKEKVGYSMLLNAQGYWLKGANTEDEWGFMFKDHKDRSMARRDPEIWACFQFALLVRRSAMIKGIGIRLRSTSMSIRRPSSAQYMSRLC